MNTTTLRSGIRVLFLLTISFLVIVGCSATLSDSFIKKNPEISNLRDQLTESEAVYILRRGLCDYGSNNIKEIDAGGIRFSVSKSEVVSVNYTPVYTGLKQTTRYRVWTEDHYVSFRDVRYVSFTKQIFNIGDIRASSSFLWTIGICGRRDRLLAAFLKLCPNLNSP